MSIAICPTRMYLPVNEEGWGTGEVNVSCILRHWASNSWLTVGQGLLSLQQVRVEGVTFFISSVSSLSLIFLFHIFSTISSSLLLPFSGRRHKMTHKG